MLETRDGVRTLGPADLPELSRVVRQDPIVNVFVDHRLATTRLEPRWFGGHMWGYYEGETMVSACHVAANLVPVSATPAALDAFGRRAATMARMSSSLLGPRDDVLALWEHVRPSWGEARSLRLEQPFLLIDGPPQVAPDPRVRRVLIDELDLLYPASVAMFTEEIGESPEAPGRHSYRARVAQLISKGWAFAIIEDERVVFKAEVTAATEAGCHIQGVWIDPSRRGEGLSESGMAAVVVEAMRTIAPTVTLYVNDHNTAARRSYARVGFRQVATFASILF
ncbi:GNAT family N-acetyltransferase [Solicola sp. PLA-1-18]|uniref:GNAT family N-acetyltransferase n=1 Tax=Solicola sp. PLA-1-18 TaxID=3380532 RepID=UPI003B7935FE